MLIKHIECLVTENPQVNDGLEAKITLFNVKARIQIFLDKGRDGILLKKLKIDPFKFDLRFENLVGIIQAFKTIA